MKIKYAFLDGTVTEVEVSDEVGAVIIDSRIPAHEHYIDDIIPDGI